jgi:hypothetical protein
MVRGCDFHQALPHISLGEKVDTAVIVGNLFTGPIKIDNQSKKDVQVGLNVSLPSWTRPAPKMRPPGQRPPVPAPASDTKKGPS